VSPPASHPRQPGGPGRGCTILAALANAGIIHYRNRRKIGKAYFFIKTPHHFFHLNWKIKIIFVKQPTESPVIFAAALFTPGFFSCRFPTIQLFQSQCNFQLPPDTTHQFSKFRGLHVSGKLANIVHSAQLCWLGWGLPFRVLCACKCEWGREKEEEKLVWFAMERWRAQWWGKMACLVGVCVYVCVCGCLVYICSQTCGLPSLPTVSY
jgi:hypothetical protein